MRHQHGTYEPDRPRRSPGRFAASVLAWGLLLALGGALAFLAAELLVAVLDGAFGRP